jgi:hypothetical protein
LIGQPVRSIAFLLAGAVAFDTAFRLRGRRVPALIAASTVRVFAYVHALSPTASLVLVVVVTSIGLETVWTIVGCNQVLTGSACPPPLVKVIVTNGQALFARTAWTVLIAIGLTWLAFRYLVHASRLIHRALSVAQAMLVLAGIGVLPVVYGKLLLPLDYPVASVLPDSAGRPAGVPAVEEKRLLLAETEKSWILWDRSRREVAVLPRNDKTWLAIGQREPVVTLGQEEPKDAKR